ncbi:MAG: hypothetical protein CW345_05280 [Firmicutes bacterium]|nr:hypothetical protein [Bacillota bacterium]MBO2521200.1 hypothetical protein [Bacillota bacterium]
MVHLSNISPHAVERIGGFLGERFHNNKERRLKNWTLVEDFISLYERKSHQEWFWIGEQAGKWLDAAAYAAVISRDDELAERVLQAVDQLARSQEADGYLGVTAPWNRTPVRGMQLYEWYFLIHGLLVCHELLGSEQALETAKRLGDFIMRTWGVGEGRFPLMGRFPGNGHDGGEGTLILEPMVLLGLRTGDEAVIRWCEETVQMWDQWAETYPESRHTGSYSMMKAVASGEADVYQVRENVHAHTLHMTLLGLAALYEATGSEEYRRVVLGCVDRIRETMIFITGGMSSGERYVPYPFYNPRNDIEVCPMHSWVLLANQALLWTGKPEYAEEIERTLLNNFLAAQRADGSNWHYMIPMNHPAQPCSTPNCCNSSGPRLIARMPAFLYGRTGDGLAIHLYCDSEIRFEAGGVPVHLVQETAYPSDGLVRITVQPEAPCRFTLHLRIPSWADEARIAVNGEGTAVAAPGTYERVEREWRPGDRVELQLPMPIRLQRGPRQAAVIRGPLVYAYFQSMQDDPARFYWNHGVYPDDVELVLDSDSPAELFREEAAPEGWLGPALRVRAVQKPRAPMFASESANRRLPGAKEFSARLLPFANQGAQQGHYAVFLDYTASSISERLS